MSLFLGDLSWEYLGDGKNDLDTFIYTALSPWPHLCLQLSLL